MVRELRSWTGGGGGAGRRRWCSMDRCGNRAKVRAFRDRRHKEDGGRNALAVVPR